MCGISGVVSYVPLESLVEDVRRTVESQRTRGPDFQAIEVIPGHRAGAVLGHNRLSIIDLSAAGNQPMWDGDHRFCISYNGEVYNYVELRAELAALGHRFASTSDTEVILEAFKEWGTDAFGRFNGMFAFGLWDAVGEELHLVRDRFGVKPLYYCLQGDTLYFASSAQCMAEQRGLEPDLEYAARGLQYGLYEEGDRAPFVGMKAVPPGHWLRLTPGRSERFISTPESFYDLQGRVASLVDSLASIAPDQAAALCAELLADSVDIRLRSDVPVAVSLSGGLDSSSVAALAARRVTRLRGFTFGHLEASASEGPRAAELADEAGIETTYVWPGIDEICTTYEKALHAQVGPFPDGSILAQFLVFEAARRSGFKVLLGGQGGDEAFMGYRKFQVFHLRDLAARKQYASALAFAVTLLPTFVAEHRRWGDLGIARKRYGPRSGLATVLSLPTTEMTLGHDAATPLRDRQLVDVMSTSLPTLLRYEDCNSMGNSIESRLPFVDYRVMELGLALPEALKMRGGYGKWVVREAMKAKIPDSIRKARYKRGFDVQQSRWVDEGLGNHIRVMLQERSNQVQEWLPTGTRLPDAFSNEALKRRPGAFAEATTLLWLADATNQR